MTRLRRLVTAAVVLAAGAFIATPGPAEASSPHRVKQPCTAYRLVGSAKDHRFRTCASIYVVARNSHTYAYLRGTVVAQYQTRPDGTWHQDAHRVSIGYSAVWDHSHEYGNDAHDSGKGRRVVRSPIRRCTRDLSANVSGSYGSATSTIHNEFGLAATC